MKPSLQTTKRLFALSQNRCASPGCPNSIVEDSGTITGITCHIKARSKLGPRYDKKQTEKERYSFSNLILLCAQHSKLIDSEPDRYPVPLLREWKNRHEQAGVAELSKSDAIKAKLLFDSYSNTSITAGGHVMLNSPGGTQTSNLVIKSERKTVKILPPEGSLASDVSRRNYVKHLIDRYNDFASKQPGRDFRHAAIYPWIRARYGAKWDLIPIHQFADLVSDLQKRVDSTMLGSMNRGKGIPNYSTFEEFRRKYERR